MVRMGLTEGMKWTIIGTLCFLAFIVCIAFVPGGDGESEGDLIKAAERSCPNGLASVKFRSDTRTLEKVVCK